MKAEQVYAAHLHGGLAHEHFYALGDGHDHTADFPATYAVNVRAKVKARSPRAEAKELDERAERLMKMAATNMAEALRLNAKAAALRSKGDG